MNWTILLNQTSLFIYRYIVVLKNMIGQKLYFKTYIEQSMASMIQ